MSKHAAGFLFAILAYLLWGIFPLYWKLLIALDSLHILAFRILLSLVLVGIILLAHRNYKWLTVFREPKKAGLLALAALTICGNWGLYIWSVNHGHTIEASLGYYINPLVSIVLGLLVFRERLKPLQWAAVGTAFTGVLILTVLSGTLPLISLALALSFGFYGLCKKKLANSANGAASAESANSAEGANSTNGAMAALESLGTETLISAPVGIALLCFTFGPVHGLAYLSDLPSHVWALLALAGLATMLPLYFFSRAAQTIPLSALGFTQFLAPTIQFSLGLFVFKESFPAHQFIAFILIWAAVILYIISLNNFSPKFSHGNAGVCR